MRRLVGVEAQGMTACPCAQELVADAARERLVEQGFTDDEIERVFESVPVATHNQRGIGTLVHRLPGGLRRGAAGRDAAADRRGLDELGDLRADEALGRACGGREGAPPAAVRRGLRARDAARAWSLPIRSWTTGAFVLARQENLETIHQHNVVAERYGLFGEIRAELDSGHHSPRHVTMREWLESPSQDRA